MGIRDLDSSIKVLGTTLMDIGPCAEDPYIGIRVTLLALMDSISGRGSQARVL